MIRNVDVLPAEEKLVVLHVFHTLAFTRELSYILIWLSKTENCFPPRCLSAFVGETCQRNRLCLLDFQQSRGIATGAMASSLKEDLGDGSLALLLDGWVMGHPQRSPESPSFCSCHCPWFTPTLLTCGVCYLSALDSLSPALDQLLLPHSS